jgi:asparagine synthase (glutamine-hydrolysing)
MCGIAGELTFNGSFASTSSIERMAETLAPRGPDGSGTFAEGRVAFGHRRLKIIDLSDHSHQPMIDPDLGLVIVFNGCIYNYKDLRNELRTLGYRFFSQGDTEVILKAYHAWGENCVERFNGMFAFAIYEKKSGNVFMARDRFGIKPLYFSKTNERMRFASTLPALLAAGDVDTSLDPQALHNYLHWHAVVPAPRTLLNGVRKLEPGCRAIITPNGDMTMERYWSLAVQPQSSDADKTPQEWEDELLQALRESVNWRMVADVPVGVLLSGGVDSSLIVGLLAEAGQENLNTFSVGFEEAGGEKGDEFKYSDFIAKEYGTQHHKIFVPSSRLLDNLPKTIKAMSEPMVSYDNIGFFLLSQEVSQHLHVVQSGQGADEIFGGYHWYPPMAELGEDTAQALDTYERVFFDQTQDEYAQMVHPRFYGDNYSRAFVERHFDTAGADSAVNKALRLDSTVMLVDDPVKRVDNMTMAWGLEARVPFLDHNLAELAGRIPSDLKIRDGGKWILKQVARRVIPSYVIDRPKGYFPVPALKYIQGPYLEMVRDVLHSQRAVDRQIFQPAYIEKLLQNPKDHITPLRGSKLWQVALLEMWLQEHGI